MIEFYDLKKIHDLYYAKALKEAAVRVIDSGNYILGDELLRFEAHFAYLCGTKYAIGVGCGLDALKLILRGYMELGILEQGDKIIVPANTFIATALAITECNLTPIFVDPCISTYNLDLNKIEDSIDEDTGAIIVVHLYGRPCWGAKLNELSEKYNLLLIEDNAQAVGARFGEETTGSLGHAAAHSFYPTKILGALGDGGAITTNNIELKDIILKLRNYGSKRKYIHDIKGVNSRLDEIQAAFLNVKLDFLEREIKIHRAIAKEYNCGIKNKHIILPINSDNPVWHQYVIRVKNRESLRQHLTMQGIQTMIHYPIPIHKQEAFKQYDYMDLPVAEQLSKEILSLPISRALTMSDIKKIINTINSWKG